MAAPRRRLAARGGVLRRPDRTAIGAPCVLAANDDPLAGERPNSQTRALVCRAMLSRLQSLALGPRLLAIGIWGGLLSGLLGVGGGIVMVPLLVLWAGYAQRDAHAASLAAIIPISVAGILTYGIAGEVKLGPAAALAAGSIFGAQLGAGLLASLPER